MKAKTRFFIAKYVRDVQRMEPRNIGIIAWSMGLTAARFLGMVEQGAEHHHIPGFVAHDDRYSYGQWMEAWPMLLRHKSLDVRATGKTVSRDDTEFMDAIRERSKPKFFIAEAGEVSGKLNDRDLDKFVTDAFVRLVVGPEEERRLEPRQILEKQSAVAIESSRLRDPQFHMPRSNLIGRVFGVVKYFAADYAFAVEKDAPHCICKRVVLGTNSANLAALMFDGLRHMNNGRHLYKTCALVSRSLTSISPAVAADEAMLEQVADVVDVGNTSTAAEALEKLAGLS